jgi:probable hydroxymethylpyrimidine transporter cytX
METVKMSFGNKGGLLFSVLNVIQLVGWTAIMIYDGSLSVNSILNMGDTGRWIACIVIGALIVLWILVGISNLGKLNTIAMAALFILTIVMCFFIFGNGNGMGAAGDDSMSFGAAVELSVAMPLSWLPLISDYTREAEKPFKATLASTLVYGAVSCWMYIIGMSASILTGESDIAKIMLKSGLSIAGLVIVILSTVTTTFLDAYSAGISSESIFSKLKGKYVAVAVTIVGVIAAIIYPMDDITDFLYLIGSVFAPMIAIQIADFFILKKDRANKAVDICNIIVWLAGFAAYRFLMNVDIIVGNTLPDMVFTIILCVIVTKIADKITSKSQKA